MTKLGEVNNSTYYYFGPPDCDIDDNGESYVTMNGVSYRFIRAESMSWKECRPLGGHAGDKRRRITMAELDTVITAVCSSLEEGGVSAVISQNPFGGKKGT
jgi:predicted heme/steroid binding protein